MKYADLHVHTNFSDGTFTPEEVVERARASGLSSIAICDHDCVDGIGPAEEHARGTPLEIIPGVELTVIKNGKEIHVLGYFISWKEKWFTEILKRVQREREARIDKMLSKLKRFDINLDRERVTRLSGGRGSVGRLHLARALKEAGAVSSVQKAFDLYIGDFKPCYVEDIGFGPKEAVDIILKAKGVPVLAHPAVVRNDTLVQEFIKDGIRGIEAYHSDHATGDREKYEKMAKRHNLLITGGSDCHGYAKYKVLMGGVKVPYDVVERLKKEAEIIKADDRQG
jgi:predicted metal-dependent phosphoesterase TrpH